MITSLHDSLTDFRQEDVTQEAGRVFTRLASCCTPAEKPRAIILGGQPGAGKSTIALAFAEDFGKNVLMISGDDYRNAHPNHVRLVEKYGRDATPAANSFSGAVAEELIAKGSAAGYNLIIEGTLRTVEVPIKTCRLLKERGYTVELACMAVRPEISYVSTLFRYEMMREYGTTPRATSKEVHDQTVANLPFNLNTLYAAKCFNTIQLYTRDASCIYDSATDRQFPSGKLFSVQEGPWNREDINALLSFLEQTEALMMGRNAPELSTFLRERMTLISTLPLPQATEEAWELD